MHMGIVVLGIECLGGNPGGTLEAGVLYSTYKIKLPFLPDLITTRWSSTTSVLFNTSRGSSTTRPDTVTPLEVIKRAASLPDLAKSCRVNNLVTGVPSTTSHVTRLKNGS